MNKAVMLPRPKITPSVTKKVKLTCGSLYIIITTYKGELFEVFLRLGKSGCCSTAQVNALAIAISIGLRSNADPKYFIKHLKGTRCENVSYDGEGKPYLSCADAVARYMEEVMNQLGEKK